MSVYIFTLMAGYVFSGVDSAQGYRARILENASYPVKFIFTELPTRRDIFRYGEIGIKPEQMLDMHRYFTDNRTLELHGSAENKLVELREVLHCTSVERRENEIWMIRNGSVIASILLDGQDRDSYYGIHYYNQAKLVRTEIYTNGISYVNYYVTARSEQKVYAKLVRRVFYNRNGGIAYDQIFEGKKEWYLFPDGRRYTKLQFFVAFIRKLNLKEQDVVLLDRPARFEFLQPIFQFKNKARLIVVMHSRHFYEKGENPYDLYLPREYDYCFKYSGMIDTVVVSTQEQKEELVAKLKAYQCIVPKIAVIPAGGVKELSYPVTKRHPYSLLTVSRLERQKKLEWVIKGVIKAHQINSDIFIDIYGKDDGYLGYLQDLVSQNQAQSYIHFMGWADVTEIYKKYEVYLTASLGESLGLSLLEAVSSGTAMVGLDVKYGNRLFIQPGRNGYLVNFTTDYVDGEDEELTDAIAEKIIEVFIDKERLERFHQNSYEIAKGFYFDIIAEKWNGLIQKYDKQII